MKLDGPTGLAVRVEFHPVRSRAVVRGIFPPERAAWYRMVWQRIVDAAQPKMCATYEEEMAKYLAKIDRAILYGDSDVSEPVGVLRGVPPLHDIARQLGLA